MTDDLKQKVKKIKNIAELFLVKIVSMGLKYLILFFLSISILNPDEFGVFSLYLVILNMVYLFVGFGVLDTGMYLISKENKENSRSLCGTLLVLSLIITFLYVVILIFVLSIYNIEDYLLISLMSSGYIFSLFVKKISIGMHLRFSMYYFELIMYALTLLVIYFYSSDLTSSIFIYSFVMLIVSVVFIIGMKPQIKKSFQHLNMVIVNIKKYGLRVHISQFIAMGTYDLDKIMLNIFHGAASVGIYNLSLNFIMPLKLFSTSISEMLFKDFSRENKIKKEVFIINIAFSILGSIVLTIIGYYLIKHFYSEEYYEIYNYIYLLPVLGILSSLYVPINNFFSAKGLAKEKLINAIVLAVCNVLFNLIFIPMYGIIGAVIATIIALIINNFLFVYQYLSYLQKNRS